MGIKTICRELNLSKKVVRKVVRFEELRLATAERLANCIALCCVVAWRVSWLAMALMM